MTGRPIHVLPPEVAARIAAGEVIERPVSVVRELLDNAIDAGATRITVEIEDGGLGLIRVTDDGRGIAPDELELAFERHATSKIDALDDLIHVRTLGFRGEALPSIAAAADVEVVSRARDEPVAAVAVLVDARVVRRTSRAGPVGTSFAVRELFGRLPARRKFLGSPVAEARQISVLVSHYALAYPEVAFQLTSNERRQLTTSGDGDLRHAFAAVHGADQGRAMLDVLHREEGVEVTGLAGPPSVHRGNRAAVSVFVNGRWVQSRALVFAIVDAYQGQLPVGRHPVASIAIRLEDGDVDVNVHPAKAEVRFRDERAVARAVRHGVTAALEGASPVRWELGPQPETARADGGVASRPLSSRLTPAALTAPDPLQARFPTGGAGAESPRTHREVLPLLRVVGQLGLTYIVAEGPDGMYLVDQHAAHERVVFDRLQAMRTSRPGEPPSQPLLEPIVVEVGPLEAATAAEYLDHLGSLGFDIEPFGDGALLLRAAPAGIGDRDPAEATRSLLDQLAGERRVADPFERTAATVACHSSVRAGMALATEQMRRLLEDLGATASPRTCPHGRPTLVHMGSEAIERQFGRR